MRRLKVLALLALSSGSAPAHSPPRRPTAKRRARSSIPPAAYCRVLAFTPPIRLPLEFLRIPSELRQDIEPSNG
jgi:hypothetical protein